MDKPKNHILITITAYRLLVVTVITLIFVFFTGVNLETNSLKGPETALFSKITGLIFPLLFTVILMVDLILILSHKRWAYILFFLLGLLLLVVLLMQKPIDWLSLAILVLILVIFVLFRPKKPQKEDKNDLPDDHLEESLNNNE